MNSNAGTSTSQGSVLCKSCGLCCTGHLFSWVRLKSSELVSSEALGLHVIRSDPRQRGFTQPCPLWQGECTIYTSPFYPRGCHSYKCKLLKEVFDGSISLPVALPVVQQAKEMINEMEALLPVSSITNFRERLVEHLAYLDESAEEQNTSLGFRLKAIELLDFYKNHFGVKDLVDDPEED